MTYERTTGTQRVVQERRPWTPEEDELLRKTVERLGEGNWTEIAKEMPGRTPKQCYDRWNRYLNPNLKKEPWSPEEDRIIIESQRKLGNQWKKIAPLLPGRSDSMVRNRWYNVLQCYPGQGYLGQPTIYPQQPLQLGQGYPGQGYPGQGYLGQPTIYPQQPLQLGQGYPGQGYPGQPTIHQQPLQNPQGQPTIYPQQPPQLGQGYPGQPTIHQQLPQNPQGQPTIYPQQPLQNPQGQYVEDSNQIPTGTEQKQHADLTSFSSTLSEAEKGIEKLSQQSQSIDFNEEEDFDDYLLPIDFFERNGGNFFDDDGPYGFGIV